MKRRKYCGFPHIKHGANEVAEFVSIAIFIIREVKWDVRLFRVVQKDESSGRVQGREIWGVIIAIGALRTHGR